MKASKNRIKKSKKVNFEDPCTRCFSYLGVGSRMKIYKYLRSKGKKNVSEIVGFIGLTQPTVSYHLNEMKSAGLLQSKKKGKEVFYSLSENCPYCSDECFLHRTQFPRKN